MTSTDAQPSPANPNRPGLIARTWLHRSRALMAFWLLGSLALGAVAYREIKPTYKALSLLRVDPMVTDLYNVKGSPDPIEPFLQTQVQLITSPNVLTAAGTNPKAAVLTRISQAGDVVQELKKSLSVSIIPNTYLLEVSMISQNGFEAATIVNAVVDSFIEANSEWSDGMTRQQIKSLEQYSLDLKNQTDELERKWKSLAAKGDLDLNNGGKEKPDVNRQIITIEEFRQIRQQLNDVKLELAQAQAWLATAKAALQKAGNAQIPAEEQELIESQVKRRLAMDPEFSPLFEEVKKAEVKVSDAARTALGPNDVALNDAKRKYDGLKARYHELSEARSKALREEIVRGAQGDPEREVREATLAVNRLQARQTALITEFQTLDVKNKNQATDAVEISLIQDERRILVQMQEKVTLRLEQLKYEAKGEARIRPVNPNGATVPTRPYSDLRPAILPVIPFAMLFVAFGLFLGIEAYTGSKARAEPIEPEIKG